MGRLGGRGQVGLGFDTRAAPSPRGLWGLRPLPLRPVGCVPAHRGSPRVCRVSAAGRCIEARCGRLGGGWLCAGRRSALASIRGLRPLLLRPVRAAPAAHPRPVRLRPPLTPAAGGAAPLLTRGRWGLRPYSPAADGGAGRPGLAGWLSMDPCGRYAASRDKATLITEFDVVKAPARDLQPRPQRGPTREVTPSPTARRARHRESRLTSGASWPSSSGDWSRKLGQDPGDRFTHDQRASQTLTEKARLPAREWPSGGASSRPTALLSGTNRPTRMLRRVATANRSDSRSSSPADGSVLAMAGLYEFWRNPDLPEGDPAAWLWTTTVITTSAPTSGLDHDPHAHVCARSNGMRGSIRMAPMEPRRSRC